MDEITKRGLGIALERGDLAGRGGRPQPEDCGVDVPRVDPARRRPSAGRSAAVRLGSRPVGRVAASLRHGRWNYHSARVESFSLDALLSVVQSFHGLPIYGWAFFDQEPRFAGWSTRLSLDEQFTGEAVHSHTIDLFQDGGGRVLDVRIWFDDVRIRNPRGDELSIDDVIAGGRRWWDALNSGDARTEGHGIFPLKRSTYPFTPPAVRPATSCRCAT